MSDDTSTYRKPPYVDVIRYGVRWGAVRWSAEFEPAEPNTEEAAQLIASGHEVKLGAVPGHWQTGTSL